MQIKCISGAKLLPTGGRKDIVVDEGSVMFPDKTAKSVGDVLSVICSDDDVEVVYPSPPWRLNVSGCRRELPRSKLFTFKDI